MVFLTVSNIQYVADESDVVVRPIIPIDPGLDHSTTGVHMSRHPSTPLVEMYVGSD